MYCHDKARSGRRRYLDSNQQIRIHGLPGTLKSEAKVGERGVERGDTFHGAAPCAFLSCHRERNRCLLAVDGQLYQAKNEPTVTVAFAAKLLCNDGNVPGPLRSVLQAHIMMPLA